MCSSIATFSFRSALCSRFQNIFKRSRKLFSLKNFKVTAAWSILNLSNNKKLNSRFSQYRQKEQFPDLSSPIHPSATESASMNMLRFIPHLSVGHWRQVPTSVRSIGGFFIQTQQTATWLLWLSTSTKSMRRAKALQSPS
jgi:hypothetical protein